MLPRMLVGTAQPHETKGDTMTARPRLVSRSLAAAAVVATVTAAIGVSAPFASAATEGDNREASVPAGIMIDSGSWSTPSPRAGVFRPGDAAPSAGAAASNHR